MPRAIAPKGVARHIERPARSIACIAFVALIAAAFWAGALYIGQVIAGLASVGY